MENIPQISNAEWEVMKVIWEKAPVKSAEVIDILSSSKEWKPKTIKTLIRRLLDKAVIGYTMEGRTYIYHVIIPEERYLEQETEHFLDKLYNGSLSHLMLNFVKNDKLSDLQVNELIDILNKTKK